MINLTISPKPSNILYYIFIFHLLPQTQSHQTIQNHRIN